MSRLATLLCAAMTAISPAGLLAGDIPPMPFPEPDTLSPAVAFWRSIFTQIDSAGGLIHDSQHLDVVYGTLYLNPGASARAQNKVIQRTLRRYREALLGLASAEHKASSPIENRAGWAWRRRASKEVLEAAAERVRFQRGQSDRILAGLGRYAGWKTRIQSILREQGLPTELAALPLVESSYNPRAVSKAGAVGLWQFMPATARSFLRVDDLVDERLDPIKSSTAAARLIRENYSVLKRWPLAITAYNHGLPGVRRAVRETGSEDLGQIAKVYEGERFGFASRNFYAAFLAAAQVARDPGRYFGTYLQDAGDQTALVVPAYMPVEAIVKGLGIELNRLRVLNPSLHYAVWSGARLIPKGYLLQLPGAYASPWAESRLTELAEHFGFSSQISASYYEVVSGDFLSGIAKRYDTTVEKLLEMNDISSPDELHAGQILRVPTLSDPEPLGVAGAVMLAGLAHERDKGPAGELLDEPGSTPEKGASAATSDDSSATRAASGTEGK